MCKNTQNGRHTWHTRKLFATNLFHESVESFVFYNNKENCKETRFFNLRVFSVERNNEDILQDIFTIIDDFVHLLLTSKSTSLRKEPTFREALEKRRLSNEHRNSILMTRHYPDLGSSSDWLKREGISFQPVRSAT